MMTARWFHLLMFRTWHSDTFQKSEKKSGVIWNTPKWMYACCEQATNKQQIEILKMCVYNSQDLIRYRFNENQNDKCMIKACVFRHLL